MTYVACAGKRSKGSTLKTFQGIVHAEGDALGAGLHINYFAPRFLNVRFQPSDCDQDVLASSKRYLAEAGNDNVACRLAGRTESRLETLAGHSPAVAADQPVLFSRISQHLIEPWREPRRLLRILASSRHYVDKLPRIFFTPAPSPAGDCSDTKSRGTCGHPGRKSLTDARLLGESARSITLLHHDCPLCRYFNLDYRNERPIDG
ncbi:DUF938 domain-containing protein [Bradyrhizobium sp. USDA 10063]